jgi:hypothetical protein
MCIRVMFLSRRQRCNEIDTRCSLFSQLRVAAYDEPSNEIWFSLSKFICAAEMRRSSPGVDVEM